MEDNMEDNMDNMDDVKYELMYFELSQKMNDLEDKINNLYIHVGLCAGAVLILCKI